MEKSFQSIVTFVFVLMVKLSVQNRSVYLKLGTMPQVCFHHVKRINDLNSNIRRSQLIICEAKPGGGLISYSFSN